MAANDRMIESQRPGRSEACGTCGGSGKVKAEGGAMKTCPACRGKGKAGGGYQTKG